ncbi:MAG: 16S rRNA (cytidine(1402)-2'-O)-methyltransferase [Gammaproteobacteria bacterium]|nr:16S rRNA (cytidine(1402)-2'-O)-methyltransferase [Gammaproteobacteria bacterium]
MDQGILFVVATPMGNLQDMSHRAVAVLKRVDLIAAEDTRHSAKLLNHYSIATSRISLHEHNEQSQTQRLLKHIKEGKSVALICDAGTPLISDPGYRLVKAARLAGIKVSPIPGACAAIAALSVSGLPTDRFVFEGFLPAKGAARRARLAALAEETRTLMFYESSHRITQSLQDMTACLGSERQAVVAREMTKTFETVKNAPLEMLCRWLNADLHQQRGEFVVLVEGAASPPDESSEINIKKILSVLLKELPLNSAVRLVVEITGEKKNRIYKLALSLQGKGG